MKALLSSLVVLGFGGGAVWAQQPQDREPSVVVARGSAFVVTCHGGDQRMADLALAAVEPVWPEVCAFFGVAPTAPGELLEVHLYATLDGYRTADRRLTGGRFQPNLAMSHWESESAHVALQPPCDDAWLAAEGLPLLTETMLAWEACHVARFRLCPNFRLHPGWFLDGLAATTAERVLRGRHPALDPAQPFFTQRLLRVQRLLADGALPRVAALLTDDTSALAMRDRYAARVCLFTFLRRHHDQALRELAATIRDTSAGGAYGGTVAQAAEQRLLGVDTAFHEFVGSAAVAWDEPNRTLWCLGDEWQQLGWADANALAWRREPVAGGALRASGSFTVERDGAQMNFLFGRTEGGFCSLAMIAGQGAVLLEYRSAENRWRTLGSFAAPDCRSGAAVAFDLDVQGAEATVTVAGVERTLQLGRTLPDEVVWGVGAQAGAAGRWHGVRVRSVEPR